MRDVESATHQLVIQLAEFNRVLNQEHDLIVKTMDAEGELFPHTKAPIELQKRVQSIAAKFQPDSIESGAILGAWRAWRPRTRNGFYRLPGGNDGQA